MTDSWATLLTRPALLLPHPDPYPFTKQLSKSHSHSSLRSKLKFASRHQFSSSRSPVTQLVRRATTSSTLGDRVPKLDPLYFPVIDLTVPLYEEDMALSTSSQKTRRGLAEADGCNNESDDKNYNDNDTEDRSPNSKCLPIIGSSRFRPRTVALENSLYTPGDQPHQPPSARLQSAQNAEPKILHDMTEELTSPYSLSSSSFQPPSNSSSNCSIILHARATSNPSNTPALEYSMIDLDMNTNAKIAVMKVEPKLEMAMDGRSTPLAPPIWGEVAFDNPLVSGESPSTSTSTSGSISISASTACGISPAPEVVDDDIAYKDTIAEAPAQVSRSKSTLMRQKLKRWGSIKVERRLADSGEWKSDTYPGVEDAQPVVTAAFPSTSAPISSPPSSVLISSKNQTYVHKHKRTTSFGDAAASLLLGVEQRKENSKQVDEGQNDNDDEFEVEDFEFSEKWVENATQANSNQDTSPIKRARFVILGNESDVDLPSYADYGRSSSLSPLHPVPRSQPPSTLFSSSPTSPSLHLPSSTTTTTNSIQRPALVVLVDAHEPVRHRRWTLASAMKDEAISNEGLVRELRKMHELGVCNRESKEGGRSSEGDVDSMWDVGREIWEGMLDWEKEKDNVDEEDIVRPKRCSSLLDSSSWLTAQRALLICRELIMTERHHHALLLSLLAGDTRTPPPLLMQHYAAELVHASAAVLKAMEQQPSALGVAKAFVENAEKVEEAYVRWCGVVGGWFVAIEESGNSNVKLKRNWSRYRSSIDSATSPAAADAPPSGGVDSEDGSSPPPVSPLKRVRTWRRSLPSVASLGEAGASIYGSGSVYGSRSLRRRNKDKEVDKVAEEEQSDVVGRDLSSTTPPSSPSSSSGQNLLSRPSRVRRKPAVRDLAILPTQRVMRYVLLYRDLLSHTPATSSSRVFVEQAVNAACRIADKCDQAQGNAAFVVAAATNSSGAAAAGNSPVATQSPAETETTSRRSNSGRTTATTTSVDSTPPSSVEGEQRREEAEEVEEEGQSELEPNYGCTVKLSLSMRRMSMSVSSIGWGRC